MKKPFVVIVLLMNIVSCSPSHSSSSDLKSSSSSSITSSNSESSSAHFKAYDYDEKIFESAPNEYTFKNGSDYTFPIRTKGSTKLTYTLSDDGTYYIVSNSNRTLSDNNLVIPSTYNGLPVKEIASEAFVELNWLESVYIPSSIVKIGDGAFSMSALKKVFYDAENVNDFNARNWVFYPCDNNEGMDIYFGPHVKRIPNRLFFPLSTEPDKNPLIKSVTFDKDSCLEEIGDYAFYKSFQLQEIYLPNSVKQIGDYAFYQSSLKELILPSSLVFIGSYCFAFSNNKDIKFNKSLSYVGDYAFYGNSELINLDLSETNLESISKYSFSHLDNVTYLALPGNVKVINDYAFSNLTSLKKLDLSSFNLSLFEGAFSELTNLTHLKLGSINAFGNNIFLNLNNIKELNFSGDYVSNLSISSGFFKNINVSDLRVFVGTGIKELPSYLFYTSSFADDSLAIKEMVLSPSLKTIQNNAFYNMNVQFISYLGNANNYSSLEINNNVQLNNSLISYYEGGLK